MGAEEGSGWREPRLAEVDELEGWGGVPDEERHSLVDLVNRVLDRGVVITGDVTLSVAGVDLVYLQLSALLTSVTTARRVVDARLRGGGDRGALPGG
jgi:hypothetical protein